MTHYLLTESKSPLNGALTTLLLLAVLLCAPAVGDAQTFTLYDSFDAAAAINAALWSGFEQNTNPDAIVNLEVQRKIVPDPVVLTNRFLQESLATAHTGTGSDTGRAGEGRLSLRINKAELRDSKPAITGIGIKGLIVKAQAPDCSTNSLQATVAGAFIFGFFFNDGTSTGAGDRTGDVYAGIEVALDSNAGRQFVAILKRCDDSTCASTSTVTPAVTFNTTWQVGVEGWVTVEWDHPNHQFVYFLGSPTKSTHGEEHALPYGLSDTTPPVDFVHDLRIFNDLPNCSAPIKAVITVQVDKVLITTENVFP